MKLDLNDKCFVMSEAQRTTYKGKEDEPLSLSLEKIIKPLPNKDGLPLGLWQIGGHAHASQQKIIVIDGNSYKTSNNVVGQSTIIIFDPETQSRSRDNTRQQELS